MVLTAATDLPPRIGRHQADSNHVVVFGAIAYDTIETQRDRVDNVLGGSASYFALAARFFSPVGIIGAVGTDFRDEDMRRFIERDIDVRGLQRSHSLTMRWHGRYHEDMNKRDTLDLALNAFADFNPVLLPDQRSAKYIFLGNIAPELQIRVLAQLRSPRVVAADTMDHWIENERPALMHLLERVNILMVNDDEARLLSGEHNLIRAGRAILKMGPTTVLVKRGEYGVLQFASGTIFAVPAYPLEEVIDPSGAGDTFAGGFMGFLARNRGISDTTLRNAVVYGSVLASFVVERFSLERLAALTWEEIEQRYRAFVELTDSRYSR
jgi:sugar/nucleoside kinase (ribokinase family)